MDTQCLILHLSSEILVRFGDQRYLTQSEEFCWTTFHLLFSDILQPQCQPDLRQRCMWIGCSFASKPEPSDTKVSPALHVLLLNSCTLVLRTAMVVYTLNRCSSTSVQLLRSKTWRARLTLVSEASGSLAKLQLVHEHLRLRSGSNWGCRMSENKRYERWFNNLFTLCKVSLVLVPHYWNIVSDTVSDTVCQFLS